MISIQKNIFEQLVEWTKAEKPNEAAGYLFNHNSLFKKIITDNKSVVHFFDDNTEKLLLLIEKYGHPTAIFHSHPGSAVPSGMDFEYMTTTIPFFGCVWIIMSRWMNLRAWTLKTRIEKDYSVDLGKWIDIDHGYNVKEIEVEIIE